VAAPVLSAPTALERLITIAHGNDGYVPSEHPSLHSKRSAMISAAIDELRAAPPSERVQLAKKAHLPSLCVSLCAQGDALLAFMIDDEILAAALGDAAAAQWLQWDASGCIAHVMARAHLVSPSVLLLVLAHAHVDHAEAFEVLAPRYRQDAALREQLTRPRSLSGTPKMRASLSDPRFVDLALERLRDEPGPSCRLLGVQASARALDELRALFDGATSFDETASAALDGLELALEEGAFIDLLVTFLSSSPLIITWSVQEIAALPLGRRIAMLHNPSFRHHPVVLHSERLQELMQACVDAHPVVASPL
jgi:hypothetical protein